MTFTTFGSKYNCFRRIKKIIRTLMYLHKDMHTYIHAYTHINSNKHQYSNTLRVVHVK